MARRATFVTFALMGVVSAVWVVRIPGLREKLELSDAQVGIEVLAWGLGALAAMQMSRRLFASFGTDRILRQAVPGAAAGLLLLGFSPNYAVLLVGGLTFGLLFGLVDVAVNAQTAQLERACGQSLMGKMHAGWSLGAVVGGLLGAGTAALGLGFATSVASVSVLILPLTLMVTPHFIPDDSHAGPPDNPSRRLPRSVVLLGSVMFCAFLAEGAVADWGSLHMHDGFGVSEAVAALAYPVFEIAMLASRLACDRIAARFGGRAMLASAGLIASVGFAVLILSCSPAFAFAGFALTGGAISIVVPLTFSMAGLAGAPNFAAAVARAGTIGYSGYLLGPVVIGLLANHSSVRLGFLAVLGACGLIAVGAWMLPDLRVEKANPVP